MSKLIEISYGREQGLEVKERIDVQFKPGDIYYTNSIWIGEWAVGEYANKYHIRFRANKELDIDQCRKLYPTIPEDIRNKLATISWDFLTYENEIKYRYDVNDLDDKDKLLPNQGLSSKFIWRLLMSHKDKDIVDKEEIFHDHCLTFFPKPSHISLLTQVYDFYSGRFGGRYTPEAMQHAVQAICAAFDHGSVTVIE